MGRTLKLNNLLLALCATVSLSYLRTANGWWWGGRQVVTTPTTTEDRDYSWPDDEIVASIKEVRECDKCPNVYLPVCTTMNKTFLNVCFFFCKQYHKTFKILRRGVCVKF